MKDLKKTLYGEETGTKLNVFIQGLLDIEKKYIIFFKSRKPKNKYSEFDRLHNHYYLIMNDSRHIRFGFKKESGIDETIQHECISLLKRCFI